MSFKSRFKHYYFSLGLTKVNLAGAILIMYVTQIMKMKTFITFLSFF